MEDFPFPQHPRRALSWEERVVLLLVVIAGFGGLFFGFRYIGKNLVNPFRFTYSGPEYLSASEEEELAIKAMQERDTDSDTINDYDELYVYKTSAYLADSDSDGYDDALEIKSGNDPNCPRGRDCGQGVFSSEDEKSGGPELISGLEEPTFDYSAAEQLLEGVESPATTLSEEIPEELKKLTSGDLRDLLLQSGVDEDLLGQTSDEELQQLYLQVLEQLSE